MLRSQRKKFKKYFFYKKYFLRKIELARIFLREDRTGPTGGWGGWSAGRVVSHHGAAPAGGFGVPKMRHLVLYKLAGFSQPDLTGLQRKTQGAMRHT